LYFYRIIAAAVSMFDPSSFATIPTFLYRASVVHVFGPPFLGNRQRAPGRDHHHFYKSGVVGEDREFCGYTPPGYHPRGNYLVLYLVHGFSYDASAWTEVGRANVILDNLIAQGKVKSMIVVCRSPTPRRRF
jgi:enterochelin esterase-like enzyme